MVNLEAISEKAKHTIQGAKKSVEDPSIFHKIALIPLLAWIGLGADGISSSAYGPDAAFRALSGHAYLALIIAVATAITIFVISYAYSRIVEHFPGGGGGYIVAGQMLGAKAGVVSGCALLVDYVLTIVTSIVACVDALFSYAPVSWQAYKITTAAVLIVFLIALNLRGIKESIKVLAPIFMAFLAFHIALLGYGIVAQLPQIPVVTTAAMGGLTQDISAIGMLGVLAIFLRAYSIGAGTYTGIEATANGMPVMVEPKVVTAKKTMTMMAVSLAAIAGALFLCYMLWGVDANAGQTLNAVLASKVFSGLPFGGLLALVTIASEGALLIVAAQTGFIDGPRVMSNMAVDSWLPRSFAALSERLVTARGIIIMGIVAIALLFITNDSIDMLVTMYAINVFVTFSLSEFGMSKYFLTHRKVDHDWAKHIAIHAIGFAMCITILGIMVGEKFIEGGWMTIVMTGTLVVMCFAIKGHYDKTYKGLNDEDTLMAYIAKTDAVTPSYTNAEVDPSKPTAVFVVRKYDGFGIHAFLNMVNTFPNTYKNVVFVSTAVVDSGSFKGTVEIAALKADKKEQLEKYVELAHSMGMAAEYRMGVGTDAVATSTYLCDMVSIKFPNATYFLGKLVFRFNSIGTRFLHNETAKAIQKKLVYRGKTAILIPVAAQV